ncbi:hypothetical protein [Maricaulis sp. CAU 1757]
MISGMNSGHGVLFRLDTLRFDAFGRILVTDPPAAIRLTRLSDTADAIACRSGCGAPRSCDTALIRAEELVQLGDVLLVDNADFARIIAKRKATGASEAVIVFWRYREVGAHAGQDEPP